MAAWQRTGNLIFESLLSAKTTTLDVLEAIVRLAVEPKFS